MKYQCIYQTKKRRQEWSAELKLLRRDNHSCEIEIAGRGTYFHAIVGNHRYGNYICIPNHSVGCELSSYTDVFWNRERLEQYLKKVDATTVAYALSHLPEI